MSRRRTSYRSPAKLSANVLLLPNGIDPDALARMWRKTSLSGLIL